MRLAWQRSEASRSTTFFVYPVAARIQLNVDVDDGQSAGAFCGSCKDRRMSRYSRKKSSGRSSMTARVAPKKLSYKNAASQRRFSMTGSLTGKPWTL